MEGFLVERYWPGVTADAVQEMDGRLTAMSDRDVSFVASTLMPSDEVVLFEFRAADEAAVQELARKAGLRCDRLVLAQRRSRPGAESGRRASHPGAELGA